MPLDPRIEKVRKEYGLEQSDFWELPQKKGTWVAKHAALETAAAKARISFTMPQVLEADGSAKSVAICVAGAMGERTEWSIGEASPANNKNSYPYAMAEKRAKDRVILKLIGLHGLAYSEDEADDFKAPTGTVVHPTSAPPVGEDADVQDGVANWVDKEKRVINSAGTIPTLYIWLNRVCGDGATITDPESGSVLDRLKRKAPEAYGEIVKHFQQKLIALGKKDAA